jgi:hypothetical protein
LFFTWIPILALLSNYDQQICLIHVGTEGKQQVPVAIIAAVPSAVDANRPGACDPNRSLYTTSVITQNRPSMIT